MYLFDWLAHRLGLWLLSRLAVSAGEFTRSRLQSLNKIEQQAEINISSHIIKPSKKISNCTCSVMRPLVFANEDTPFCPSVVLLVRAIR